MTFAILFFIAFATVNDYQQAMERSLATLEESSGVEQLSAAANRFERIARAEEDQWLPWYYAAYATLHAAIESPSAEKDQQLDVAQQHLDNALALAPEESEVVALQGYIYTIRVTVDPANRGQELAPKATRTLTQALQLNPDNPRALYLLGQMQYGTAQFFGSDTSDICQLFTQAVEKYESATHDDALMPAWGKAGAQAMQQQCEK